MNNTKRRFETFSFFNHTGIAAHLEKMAADGWMIERLSNFGWIYQKTEPKTIHFAVSYYPKASEFDPEPSEEQQMFHEFCAHTGWKLACTSAQMQIFYNEQDNPTPIETEPELEVASIHASAKKSLFPSYIILTILALMNGLLFLSSLLGDPIGLLSSSSRLFTGFCFVLLFLLCSSELTSYFLWYKKAKKAAAHGEFLETPNTSRFSKIVVIAALIGLVYWAVSFIILGDNLKRWIGIIMFLYMPAVIFIVNGTKNFLKKKKVSTRTNFFITMAVDGIAALVLMAMLTHGLLMASSQGLFAEKQEETYEHKGVTLVHHRDELPLTIEDFMDVSYDNYVKERRGEESLLLGEWTCTQAPRIGDSKTEDIPKLQYTIVDVKVPVFYDMCKTHFIKEQEKDYALFGQRYEQINQTEWNALEAYQLYDKEIGLLQTYLLCYEDKIIEIDFGWEPMNEQKALVYEQLIQE